MKAYLFLLLIVASGLFTSCRTVNSTQTAVVKKFAVTAKQASDLPYKVMYNYYTLKFKRRQLIPENYVTGDTGKEEMDQLAENVISKIEELRDDYYDDLETANEIKTVYELLETYITSLEKLSSDKYSRDFEKESAEMGAKMNGLVTKLNGSPKMKIGLSLNPGEWLASFITMHGRIKLKTQQASLLKEYMNKADTLVQAINRNFQEIQVPVMDSWFEEEKGKIRGQFKRSVAPYLQNLNRYPDSASSVVAIEFYSKINPVYYELTEEIYRNQLLIQQTALLMNDLARTHQSMKGMFIAGNSWQSNASDVEGLKEKMLKIKDLFDKESMEKFSFFKTFLMQNEKTFKNIFNKH